MLGSVGLVAPGELAKVCLGKVHGPQGVVGESAPLWPEPEDPDRYSVRRRDLPSPLQTQRPDTE